VGVQMLKTAVFALLVLILAAGSALAEEVAGPVENGESPKQDAVPDESGKVKDGEAAPHAIFERIGIFVVRKGPANPNQNSAVELIQEYIAEGVYSEEEMLDKVRRESPVVVARLAIDLSRQRLFLLNNFSQVLGEYRVSTGMPGYLTPPGSYAIVNKAVYAYSKKYEADMYHWMGLTRNGDIGMHGLKGSGYERRLGRRASHGCIRLSREDARYLYSILPIGMPVDIVPALEQVEYYKPISDADLLKLIEKYLGTGYQPLVVF
jgi:hypothetical protein